MILKADADGVSIDDATTYQGYVKSRGLSPTGSPSQLFHARQAHLVARQETGVSVRCTLIGEFGERSATSDTSLTPEASETRVIHEFEELQDADLMFAQVQLGDSAAANTIWQLEMLSANAYGDGEA